MLKIGKETKDTFILRAIFETKNDNIIKKANVITEFVDKKEAVIFLGEKYNIESLKAAIASILNYLRNVQIDIKSFVTKDVKEEDVIRLFVEKYEFKHANIYNAKTKKADKPLNITLIGATKIGESAFKRATHFAEGITFMRNLQETPPNILNSEVMAETVKKEFSKHKDVSVKVLNKKQIEELKMGLLLSVNRASAFEARVVVLEYKGNPSSKEKTVLVGKGITFDAGGMNIKTGRFINGMKFDMSGAAAVAAAIKVVSNLKLKTNVSAVLTITDNVISSLASLPDSVFTAMNGKTVEINNTDAEGRLVMADGLTYAAKKLNATRIIDIATLTGAVVSALGSTYTGVWSTTEKGWKDLKAAAQRADELVWRMPLHKDYFKYMEGSTVADIRNTDFTGKGGSSSAAMFLTQFSEGVEHIHLDVAGTADIDHKSQGVMVKTLVEIVNG